MKNAPDGCYPVFDRIDCFLVESQNHELVIKHCPKRYSYDKNCGCESVSWWGSRGRCAAAILAGAGTGAIGGGGALSVTVYGIQVGITVGAVAGALGVAAAGCWVPE
ncbi:hypothetical protein IFO69_10220 [Echinicola sp. CAU 1574]|uniref:Uncharacterized protein n=1 Tax=Echinicola arenosa TaxID=2774144 RepID=A0ABR9AJW6_9BACT|nr:hypothetical protein [Echinicola arenosa]MBD8489120.1 hypothetical protein [Echinicola arenosa]